MTQAKGELILALETSCDDTCAAVVSGDGEILSNVISSQAELHDRYGGVVPEVASRQHLRLVNAVVQSALERAGCELTDIDKIAVTRGPGLIGALLVGVTTAKALAAAHSLPLVAVDHLHGHVASVYLGPEPVVPPFVCLVASGGHTLLADVEDRSSYSTIGSTLDDAAGEAFDKGARLLGLPYPGGAEIDALASEGDPERYKFPLAMQGTPSLDFSFSGLKTSLYYRVRELRPGLSEQVKADLAASYQAAICWQLLSRAERALERTGYRSLVLAGGVAANSELRQGARRLAEGRGVKLKMPPAELCTDNAAMIASAARYLEPVTYPHYLTYDAFSTVA